MLFKNWNEQKSSRDFHFIQILWILFGIILSSIKQCLWRNMGTNDWDTWEYGKFELLDIFDPDYRHSTWIGAKEWLTDMVTLIPNKWTSLWLSSCGGRSSILPMVECMWWQDRHSCRLSSQWLSSCGGRTTSSQGLSSCGGRTGDLEPSCHWADFSSHRVLSLWLGWNWGWIEAEYKMVKTMGVGGSKGMKFPPSMTLCCATILDYCIAQ